jgi:RNA polymerase sigma factor (TIGR02999 family)
MRIQPAAGWTRLRPDRMGDPTSLLRSMQAGDSSAAEELLPLVYNELRILARARLATEPPGQTLQPTALVHEAWLRLIGGAPRRYTDRQHFLRVAAEAMRRILVDNARRKRRQKRGQGQRPLPLEDGLEVAAEYNATNILLVHEAIERLQAHDPQKAELVKLRYFVGLSHQEIAQVFNVSEKTVLRHWAYAKAWLLDAISSDVHPQP